MIERPSADPITLACLTAGSYTLSSGTMNPAIVLERLLVALSVLSLPAYRRVVAPDGPFARAPAAALREESSSWWDTPEAGVFLQALIGAINDAAPAGYACCCTDFDRIELVRIDAGDRARWEAQRAAPPSVSTIRARVG